MAAKVLSVVFCDVLNCKEKLEDTHYRQHGNSQDIRKRGKQLGWKVTHIKKEYDMSLKGTPYKSTFQFDVCPCHKQKTFGIAPNSKDKKVIGYE